MDIGEYYRQFYGQLISTPLPDIIAVIFGMISVLLAWRNHVGLYPAGIVSTILTIYIYAGPPAKLYAEAALNGYYLVMSIYGWWRWKKNKENENPRSISHNTKNDWMITFLIVGAGWVVLYFILKNYTDSNVPVWDAIVSSTAWAGMWLLAKHKIENWLLLNISNAIAIPLLLYKGLYAFALFTLFLFIVAIFGYFRWKKQYRLLHAAS